MSGFYLFLTEWILALASVFVAVSIFKNKKTSSVSFAYFWLANALIWFNTAMAVVFLHFNLSSFAVLFARLSYLFISISTVFMIYYLQGDVLKKTKRAKIIAIFYSVGVLVFSYFVFTDGVLSPHFSGWGVRFGMTPQLTIMLLPFLLGVGISLFQDFYKRIFGRIRNGYFENVSLFIITLSIISQLLLGFLDISIVVVNWQLIFVRMVIAGTILVVYLANLHNMKENEKVGREVEV